MKQIEWSTDRIAKLRKHSDQHKYDHGHLLVLSGPRFHTGAARMAASAALRVGAGVVTIGGSSDAMVDLAPHLTEVMLKRISENQKLAAILEQDIRINALCLGPALGLDEHASGLIHAALSSRRLSVLDADALSLIARNQALRDMLHEGCVLTPHLGEFARLCPDISMGSSSAEKTEAVLATSQHLNCTILLKGAQTIIADPKGGTAILGSSKMQAAPWLATAGAGDVLAGLIAGLLARGLAPTEAAETGALLHVEAAQRCGPGLVAGDLPDQIPQVLRDLGV